MIASACSASAGYSEKKNGSPSVEIHPPPRGGRPPRGHSRTPVEGKASMPRERESEIGTLEAIAPAAHPPESKYERLIARAKQVPPAQRIAVHHGDESSLRGPIEAAELGIIEPILVGPA